MKFLLAAIILCVATPAFALDPTGTGYVNSWCPTKMRNEVGQVIMKPCKKITFNPIGLRIDAGLPGALSFSLVGRPVKFFEFDLGGSTTLVGGGIRGGGSLFLPYWVSPGITIEGGKMWAGNMNDLAQLVVGVNPGNPLLNDVNYAYASFLGSLGFGHPNWFMFRIYAGYSYIVGETSGLQAYIQAESGNPNITAKEATIKAWVPSAKLAIQIYF